MTAIEFNDTLEKVSFYTKIVTVASQLFYSDYPPYAQVVDSTVQTNGIEFQVGHPLMTGRQKTEWIRWDDFGPTKGKLEAYRGRGSFTVLSMTLTVWMLWLKIT